MKYAYLVVALFLISSVLYAQNNIPTHDSNPLDVNNPQQGQQALKDNINEKAETEISRNKAQRFQAIVTSIALIIGGVWAIWRFIFQREGVPHIEFSADINVIGKQNGYWIIELISTIENKGKAEHRIKDFNFDVYGLKGNDKIVTDERWGNQVNFPQVVAEGSHMPERLKDTGYFFIEPDVKAKYSYIVRVEEDVKYIIYHSNFIYKGRRRHHTAEKTVCLDEKKDQC